jgi:catechol 2,3-dioxygenase-like lactoylglutathione lyase family enzyme
MGYHHTAFATRDVKGTHRFYNEVTGFPLAKVIAGPTDRGGMAKHFFYEISPDEFIAFWDLHDDSITKDWSPAISTGQGLPVWVNHLAFKSTDLDDLATRRDRWLSHGVDVMEVDHHWCRSIYAVDPNGIMVEFCTTTQALGQKDREEALLLLDDPNPPIEAPKEVIVHRAANYRKTAAA